MAEIVSSYHDLWRVEQLFSDVEGPQLTIAFTA